MRRAPVRKLSTMESFEYRRLQAILRRVRWRWRLKVALRGLALLLVTALLTVSAASWAVSAVGFQRWAVLALGLLTYGALAYCAYRFVIRPLSRRVTDRQVALYAEENTELRAALLSAVEFGALKGQEIPDTVSERFVGKLVEDAVRRGREIDYGKDVEAVELKRVAAYFGAAAVTVAALLFVNPTFLQHGLPALFRPFAGAEVETPYSVSVMPGTMDVARGSDQVISAGLVGFTADMVEVSYRIGDADWQRESMAANVETGRHEVLLFRIDGDVEYFVEASAVRSEVHRLTVVDQPHVASIDLESRFPEYSGLSPQTIEDGGDIAALAGTRAQLSVSPTVAVPGGRVVVEGLDESVEDQVIDLDLVNDEFVGELEVAEAGFYRVELQTPGGEWIDASSDYLIEVLSDQPPLVQVERPGRDIDATAVEEVFTEVTVEDDFGLTGMDLVWTVNGGDEERVSLFPADAPNGEPRKDHMGAYTFYLEEYDFEPGDFIAYWAEARDNREYQGPQKTVSDIYFVEIRPFELEYRQADSGGGGGGGGAPPLGLAEQQRLVVSATFKIQRDGSLDGGPRPGVSGPSRTVTTRAESLDFLATTEDQLRDRVREAAASFTGTGDPEESARGVADLENASDALGEASTALRADRLTDALRAENMALRSLQRFEALFREMQVQQQQQGGGGGGGGGDMESIADMFDLEMDELENQYESVRRGQQEQADDAVDEATQRLKELARRQQQEIERQRANPQAGGGAGRNASQREMADQAEELARELERLARQNSRPDLQDAANRLQQAADSMRRAAGQSGQQGAAEGTRALNELQNARRLLDDMREDRLGRDLDQARESLAEMRQAQEQIEREVDRLGESGGRTGERIDDLLDRKDSLARDIQDLEAQFDDMARESRGEQMRASRALQEAAEWMRDSKLADKVRYSKGVVQERDPRYAAGFEDEISADLDRLEERLAAAEDAVEVPEEQRLGAALDDTRDLVQRLESFEERAREAGQGPGEQAGQEPGEGQAGDSEGQQGEGQQGEGEQGQGGPGGQQASPQGAGQRPNGGRLGGGGSGPPGARQLGREFDERLSDAEELRDALAEEGIQVTDLDEVIASMRDYQADFDGTARGIDQLRDDVIDGLKLFEFWLRRVADAASDERPQLAGSDRVPEGYRDLVEEYFRALAREPEQEQQQ
ncbi:MAG: DUF4175 family protein [Acidobacteria bacterium]|nr:DUF4175 family protein [Acidobacteriota bacterium]